MHLAYDICRCMGQNDFVICAERDTCARYLAAKRTEGAKAHAGPGSDGERVPYTNLLRHNSIYGTCIHKIEERE